MPNTLPINTGNSRNGSSKKTIKGDFGELEINTPRDRNGEFEPQLITKGSTRINKLDQQILSLYSRGMTTRDIADTLEEMYGADISPTLISKVTDAVLDEVKAWQNRPLESLYPVLYLDRARFKTLYLISACPKTHQPLKTAVCDLT